MKDGLIEQMGGLLRSRLDDPATVNEGVMLVLFSLLYFTVALLFQAGCQDGSVHLYHTSLSKCMCVHLTIHP